MGRQKRQMVKFSGLDFAVRTCAAWIGSWLPVWILIDACDVDIPVALLIATLILTVLLKAFAYLEGSAQTIARISLIAAVALLAVLNLDATMEGFRACFDAVAEATNRYYGTEIKLYESSGADDLEILLFLILPSTFLLLLSDSASDGRTRFPWLMTSFLFLWAAILLDVFGAVWFICLYVGLTVYFLLTYNSHGMRVAAGARYRAMVAVGVSVMLLIACLIISEDFYETKLRDSEGRNAIGNFLTSKFPILFGRNRSPMENAKNERTGLGYGELPKTDRLQFSGDAVGVVTIPSNYGTLYLRSGAYGEYTGTSWKVIEGYIGEDGQSEEEVYFLTSAAALVEQMIFENAQQGRNSGRTLRFALASAQISVQMTGESNLVLLPYNALIAGEHAELITDGEGILTYKKTQKAANYIVMSYYNRLRLPGIAACATSLDQPVKTSWVTLDPMYRQYMSDYTEYVYENYLTIPGSCSRVRDLVTGDDVLEFGPDHIFESILAVQDFLREGYAYSTRPGLLPENKDFIEYFLFENKKGYCSYFASAGVMLFRAMGIPARYVEGYAIESNVKRDRVTGDVPSVLVLSRELGFSSDRVSYDSIEVTDQFAHAWVEVFIDGYGWYPVEVTNITAVDDMDRALNEAGFYDEETPTPTPTQAPKPVQTPSVTPGGTKTTPTPKATATPSVNKNTPTPGGNNNPNGDPGPSEGRRNAAKHLRVLVRVLIVLAVIAAPIIFLRVRYSHKQRVRAKYANREDLNAAFASICRDIGRVLRIRGLTYERCEADSAFMERAGAAYGHKEDFAWLYETGCRAAYSGERITKEERREALSLYRTLRREALAECSLPKRLWRKYIQVI